MMKKIILAQIEFALGDVKQNTDQMIKKMLFAQEHLKADLIVFPELTLTGYPPKDLLFRKTLYQSIQSSRQAIQEASRTIAVIVGYPEWSEEGIYNAASVFSNGDCLLHYRKQYLPNHGLFDEKRYFLKGRQKNNVFTFKGTKIGLCICEDLWHPQPVSDAKAAGAEWIVSIHASPFDPLKMTQREAILRRRVEESSCPILSAHWVGAQDELIFDGGSMAMDASGTICAKAPDFKKALLEVFFEASSSPATSDKGVAQQTLTRQSLPLILSKEQNILDALIMSLNRYCRNNGFEDVILGLSGGIDSALTLCIAVDALGADHVEAVMLPSPYTSNMSLEDAEILAKTHHVRYSTIPITSIYDAFSKQLALSFCGLEPDVTEENLQARIRGTLLMALSNKKSKLLLTTGNKSEMAMGYATLYGDMAGGFNVLKDVSKTMVYQLAALYSEIVIPKRVINRPPSAELAPNQKDQDALPPYDILDKILSLYVEEGLEASDIIAQGFESKMVFDTLQRMHQNEYKRYQSAPGPRVTSCAFGIDWRYPLASPIPCEQNENKRDSK